MILTSAGTDGMSSLPSRDVNLDVNDALPLRFGKRLHPLVDVDKGAPIGLGQTIEGLLAVLGRHGEGTSMIGGNVPKTIGHLQELGSVDSTVRRRSQLGDDVLGLPEGSGIDGILNLQGHVAG